MLYCGGVALGSEGPLTATAVNAWVEPSRRVRVMLIWSPTLGCTLTCTVGASGSEVGPKVCMELVLPEIEVIL